MDHAAKSSFEEEMDSWDKENPHDDAFYTLPSREPQAEEDEECATETEETEESLFDDWDLIEMASAGLDNAPAHSAVMNEDVAEENALGDCIDIDDFEGPHQYIFANIKQQIRNACNINTTWVNRKRAAYWVFCSRSENSKGISFAESCRALGARRTVIQARVHYQLYRAGVPYQEPLDFLCDPLPEAMMGEMMYQYGQNGLDIARIMWHWPGVRADHLLSEIKSRLGIPAEDAQQILMRMEQMGYVAIKHGFWFFISRNPDVFTIAGRRRFQWSRAFTGSFD